MNISLNRMVLIAILALTTVSCGKAQYDIVGKPGQSEDANPNGLGDTKDSFSFEATPGTAAPNEEISFKGTCNTKATHTIEWKMGDNSAIKKGVTATHSFSKNGVYTVEGTCVIGKRRLTSKLNITISDTDGSGPNQNPNQNPNQAPVQSPVQTSPSQS